MSSNSESWNYRCLKIISCVTSAPASLPIHFLSICSLSTNTCIIRLCNSGPAPLLYIMRTFAAVCSWQTSYRCIMQQLEQLPSMDDTGSTHLHLRHALYFSSSGTPTIVGCCIRQVVLRRVASRRCTTHDADVRYLLNVCGISFRQIFRAKIYSNN